MRNENLYRGQGAIQPKVKPNFTIALNKTFQLRIENCAILIQTYTHLQLRGAYHPA